MDVWLWAGSVAGAVAGVLVIGRHLGRRPGLVEARDLYRTAVRPAGPNRQFGPVQPAVGAWDPRTGGFFGSADSSRTTLVAERATVHVPTVRPCLPGWYPDPSSVTAWRWWSGEQWTEYVR